MTVMMVTAVDKDPRRWCMDPVWKIYHWHDQ